MGNVIALVNQKGGVGKTTSAVNLAASLAELGQRVLLVDIDPQGNATMGSGINKMTLTQSINDALLSEVNIHSILQSSPNGYDLLPTGSDLTQAEVQLLNLPQREFRLRHLLQPLRATYNVILLDCPPSLNMLTLNALTAADGVIVPMQCEYYALEGLSSLLQTVSQVNASVNPKLVITGVLRTMYDNRNLLSVSVTEQLEQLFGDRLFKTTIPRNVRLAEAPSHGLAGLLYDKNATGTQAYLALARECLERFSVFEPPATRPFTESASSSEKESA